MGSKEYGKHNKENEKQNRKCETNKESEMQKEENGKYN